MTRTRLLALAAAAGIALAGGYAAGTSGASKPEAAAPSTAWPFATTPAATTPALARQDPHPPIGKPIARGLGSWRRVQAAIPGTAHVVVSQPDPAGGAPWAVRTFQRWGNFGGPARVWCAQLGRLVDGHFVWIVPGAKVAGSIRPRIDEDTVCASWAPISEKLGVMVASMPDRVPTDPAAQMEATLIWGAVDKPVRSAHVTQAGRVLPVTVQRHAFLKVLPGAVPASRAVVTVTDFDGGTRSALPPGEFDDLPRTSFGGRDTPGSMIAGALEQAQQPTTPTTPATPTPTAAPTPTPAAGTTAPTPTVEPTPSSFNLTADAYDFRELELVQTGYGDLPAAMFVRPAKDGYPTCYAGPVTAVAGRPVTPDRYSGLMREAQVYCAAIPTKADQVPIGFGGSGWTTGDPVPPGAISSAATYRRRVWRRVPPGGGGVMIAVPKGTAMLEVRSPVGVKTVRVGSERVTYVGFQGQPEVKDALFPAFREEDPLPCPRGRPGICGYGRATPIWREPPLQYRALDAQGHQLGAVGSSDPSR